MTKVSFFNSNAYVHALMMLAIILAASSFPVGAIITDELPSVVLMFFRFLLATVFFAPIMLSRHGIKFPSKHSALRYIFLSIPLVAFFWCMFESLKYTSVLNTGALYTVVPAITAVCAFLINREISGKIRSFGLTIGTIGALWIVFRGNLDAFMGFELNYGDLIFLVGCVFLGLYNPLVKRFYHGEPTEIMTFWILLSGSVLLLILSAKLIIYVDWHNVKQSVYFGIVYISLFSTLATFFLVNYSTVRIGATKVAAYGFLTPVLVIAISILTGMEEFELIIVPGLVLILAAMIIVQRDGVKNTYEDSTTRVVFSPAGSKRQNQELSS